jgi:hypothetical protein
MQKMVDLTALNEKPRFMRRKAAGAYLTDTYGFGAPATLAKGVVTGDTPAYHKAGRTVLYTKEACDQWALSKIGAPQRSSSAVGQPRAS